MTAPDWQNLQPIAHRGLHDADKGIIENTRSAVLAAIRAGYGIEVDLQLSADHQAMVFHDFTLDRLTKSTGKLIDKTSEELQTVEFAQTSDIMMTLAALLQIVAGQAPLFLEIKSQRDNIGPLERAIIAALADYTGPVAIMSFDPNSITEIRALAPQITRGIVAEGFHDEGAKKILTPLQRFFLRHLLHIGKTKPDFLAYNIKHLNSPAPRIAHRLLNYPLLTWTVTTQDDLKTANRFGATPIFEGLRF